MFFYICDVRENSPLRDRKEKCQKNKTAKLRKVEKKEEENKDWWRKRKLFRKRSLPQNLKIKCIWKAATQTEI